MPEPTFEELLDAMKTGAGALQRHEIPFVLGGGLAAWARGGPKSEHDVDLLLRPGAGVVTQRGAGQGTPPRDQNDQTLRSEAGRIFTLTTQPSLLGTRPGRHVFCKD